jgi:cyclic pyranopterin phosphate synthase
MSQSQLSNTEKEAIVDQQSIYEQRKKRQQDSLDYQQPFRIWHHLERIYKIKQGIYTPPVQVEISPTSICNQKCRFCYTFEREHDNVMDKDLMLNFFSNAKSYGVKTIYIAGTGEPLVNKHLADAINLGGQTGISMGLNTNCSLFTPERQKKSLEYLTYVKISVIDSDVKRYARNHICPESHYHNIVKNITHAANYRSKINANVSLFTTVYIDNDNFEFGYDIVKFCKEIGLDFVCLQGPAVFTQFSPDGNKKMKITDSKEKVDDLISRVRKLEDDGFKLYITFNMLDNEHNDPRLHKHGDWKPNYCHGVNLVTAISGDGEVYPCWRAWGNKELSYGNMHKQSFEEIWKGDRRKEVNKFIFTNAPKGDECNVCKININNENLNKIMRPTNKWANIL